MLLLYLSVSVSVLALLSDPVDGIEVFIGSHSRQGIVQRVHELCGAAPVHPSCSTAAAVLIVISWGEETESHREGKRKRRPINTGTSSHTVR